MGFKLYKIGHVLIISEAGWGGGILYYSLYFGECLKFSMIKSKIKGKEKELSLSVCSFLANHI